MAPKCRRINSYADLCHHSLKRFIVDIVAEGRSCSAIIPGHFLLGSGRLGNSPAPTFLFPTQFPPQIYICTRPTTGNPRWSNRSGMKSFRPIAVRGRVCMFPTISYRYSQKHTPIPISFKFPSGAHSCNMYSITGYIWG